MHGRHDIVVPLVNGEYLASHIPGARLVVFEESGHTPFLEEPEAFNAALRALLAAASPGIEPRASDGARGCGSQDREGRTGGSRGQGPRAPGYHPAAAGEAAVGAVPGSLWTPRPSNIATRLSNGYSGLLGRVFHILGSKENGRAGPNRSRATALGRIVERLEPVVVEDQHPVLARRRHGLDDQRLVRLEDPVGCVVADVQVVRLPRRRRRSGGGRSRSPTRRCTSIRAVESGC